MGPIQIFVLGFENFEVTGRVAAELEALSDAGTIRVVDARFLLKESEDELMAVRASDLDDAERADLRAAAGALVGLGAGAVVEGEEGAVAGAVLGAEAAFASEFGFDADQIDALGDEMQVGDALLLLVIENVWAEGLSRALREAGMVSGRANYVTPEGLIALGALLGAAGVSAAD
jgi:uncharacterized membrane protein